MWMFVSSSPALTLCCSAVTLSVVMWHCESKDVTMALSAPSWPRTPPHMSLVSSAPASAFTSSTHTLCISRERVSGISEEDLISSKSHTFISVTFSVK